MRNKLAKLMTFLLSMPFAILLLIWLAMISAVGSLLIQQLPMVHYVEQFGPFWARIFDVIGLTRFYLSPIFIAIVSLLLISTTLCILKRCFTMGQFVRKIRNQKAKITRRFVMHHGSFLMIHASLLFIACGATLDANLPFLLFHNSADALNVSDISFRGSIKVDQHSQPVNQLRLHQPVGNIQTIALPFSITLDQFKVSYNDHYQVKGYTSYLSFFDQHGTLLFKRRLDVNRPIDYQGMRLYQSSMTFEGTKIMVRKHDLTQPESSQVITLSLEQANRDRQEKEIVLVNYLPVNPSEKIKEEKPSRHAYFLQHIKPDNLEDLGQSMVFVAKDRHGRPREWHQLLKPVTLNNQAYWVLGMMHNHDMQKWLIPIFSNFSIIKILTFRHTIMDETSRNRLIDKMMQQVLNDPGIQQSVKQALKKDVAELLSLYATDGMQGIMEGLSRQADPEKRRQAKETIFALLYSALQTYHDDQPTLTAEQMDTILWSVSSLTDYPSDLLLEPIIWQERYASYIDVAQLTGQHWIYIGFLLFLVGFGLHAIRK